MKFNKWFWLRSILVLVGGFSGFSITSPKVVKSSNVDWETCLLILFFGPLAVLLLVGIQALNPYSNKVWRKPSWNINPFLFKEPLQFFHLGAYHFIVGGIVGCTALFYRGKEAAQLAISLLSVGIGILLGLQLSIFIYRKKMIKNWQ